MSFYALVLDGKVLGFRDHIDPSSLGLAEKTALVAWSGLPIKIYEVAGRMPDDANAERYRVETFLAQNPDYEPVSEVRAVEESDQDDELDAPELTGCYRRVDGEPGESGFFAAVAEVG